MNRRSFLALCSAPLVAALAACRMPLPAKKKFWSPYLHETEWWALKPGSLPAKRFFSEGQAKSLLPPNPTPEVTQLYKLSRRFREESNHYRSLRFDIDPIYRGPGLTPKETL